MAVTDKRIHRFAPFARQPIVFAVPSVGVSANVVFTSLPYQWVPPGQPPYVLFGWQFCRCEVFCTAVTATASVFFTDSIFTVNPMAGNAALIPAAGSVVSASEGAGFKTSPNLRVPLPRGITVNITTNGTGTVTNLWVVVTIRPVPMADEAA